MLISARSNEKVKYLRRLIKEKSFRREEGVYVAEGITLLTELSDDLRILSFYIRKTDEEKTEWIKNKFPSVPAFCLTDDVFDSVSDTVTPSGIIAIVKMPVPTFKSEERVLLLDGVSDAGNVGTIIRTACARGIKSIVLVHNCADPFSPKSVRASMGGIFKTDIFELSLDDAEKMLVGYEKIVLDMNGENIFSHKSSSKTVIIIGNEAHGVSEEIKRIADKTVSIPMVCGAVESLNASVAAGIAMYLI